MKINTTVFALLFLTLTLSSVMSHGNHGQTRNNNNGIWNKIKSLPISCDLCKVGTTLLDGYLSANASVETVTDAAIDFCTRLKIELPDVCVGIMNAYVPIIYPILVETDITPVSICDTFKLCTPGGSSESSSTERYSMNTLEGENMDRLVGDKPMISRLAAKLDQDPIQYSDLSKQIPVNPVKKTGTGYFLQLADIHFDAYYLEGSNPNCGRPLCCRDGNGTAGFFGDYQCDIPLVTVKAIFDWISKNLGDSLDFIVWTGDNPPHDVWMQSELKQTTATETLCEEVKTFFPNTAVYPSIGNHESWPADQFILPDKQWLLNSLEQFWAPFLGADQLSTVQQQGYYTLLLQPGLRIISLNTQDADMINFYNLQTVSNMNKPNNQTDWLGNVLGQAANNSEKVMIIGHIPCNLKAASVDRWCVVYEGLIAQYKDIIVGQIYGHTHDDQFSVFSDPADRSVPTGMQYIAPSLTTYQHHMPGFRVYEYDYDQNEIVNFYQYHSNLTEANLSGNVTFFLSYNAKDLYNMPDLSYQSWWNVANELKTNTTMFNSYYTHIVNSEVTPAPCEGTCHMDEVCMIFSVTSDLFDQCRGV